MTPLVMSTDQVPWCCVAMHSQWTEPTERTAWEGTSTSRSRVSPSQRNPVCQGKPELVVEASEPLRSRQEGEPVGQRLIQNLLPLPLQPVSGPALAPMTLPAPGVTSGHLCASQ